MKVSIITDEISSDPETAIELASDWGIRHFEIRGLLGKRVPDVEPQLIDRLKSIISRYGAEVVAISPGIFKCDIEDQETIKRDLEERLPRSIDLAKELKAGFIIVFGFHCKDPNNNGYIERAVSALRKASDYAASMGIHLALENEPQYLADTGERTARLLKLVEKDNLHINWDPCNAYVSGEDPSMGIEHVKETIMHVHLKDAVIDRRTGKKVYVPLGEGEVNILRQLEKLKMHDYGGFVSIETHISPNKVKNSQKCWNNLKNLLAKIDEETK
ncbi:MAG: sugar phosphate isomerase/epimerase family protein [Nitrososphaerota archaeon]|nr:sugar phosphate isomerase/epimerase [Candidatus Bathyarchaeota archaeon]MDW8049077.1 sugar phosphate isomerase/epimerase family protein [Nitrososphaerota archaeon]